MKPKNYSNQYLRDREPKDESFVETSVTFLAMAVMSFILLTIFIGGFHG